MACTQCLDCSIQNYMYATFRVHSGHQVLTLIFWEWNVETTQCMPHSFLPPPLPSSTHLCSDEGWTYVKWAVFCLCTGTQSRSMCWMHLSNSASSNSWRFTGWWWWWQWWWWWWWLWWWGVRVVDSHKYSYTIDTILRLYKINNEWSMNIFQTYPISLPSFSQLCFSPKLHNSIPSLQTFYTTTVMNILTACADDITIRKQTEYPLPSNLIEQIDLIWWKLVSETHHTKRPNTHTHTHTHAHTHACTHTNII